jgi:hypothetical protein
MFERRCSRGAVREAHEEYDDRHGRADGSAPAETLFRFSPEW